VTIVFVSRPLTVSVRSQLGPRPATFPCALIRTCHSDGSRAPFCISVEARRREDDLIVDWVPLDPREKQIARPQNGLGMTAVRGGA
jgi:hypothetical protein